MSSTVPPEIQIFERFLRRLVTPLNGSGAAIFVISDRFAEVSTAKRSESLPLLFRYVDTIKEMIDELLINSPHKRAGERLKERIGELFSVEKLNLDYSVYSMNQKSNIETIIDLMYFLDHLKFDSEGFSKSVPEINSNLKEIIGKVAKSSDFSEHQQRIIIAQVELIMRSMERFKTDGVAAFRDSISCGIGRLTIELKAARGDQVGAVRGVIDDLLRVKDLAEVAGGALALTGPYVAGLLTAPVIS